MMFHRCSLLMPACISLVWLSCLAMTARGQMLPNNLPDIHEFKIESLSPGAKTSVTGRYFSASSGLMQMVDSDIKFRLSGASKSVPRGQAVHVRGSVAIEGGQKIIHIDHLEVQPSELEQTETLRAKLEQQLKETGKRDYQTMFRLVKWSKDRGVWYSDRRLLELSAKCQAMAFAWGEEDAAEKHDFASLRQLAERARAEKLDRSIIDRLAHRAIWVELGTLPATDLAGRRRLVGEVRARLPGTEEPLSGEQQPQADAYLQDPINNYAAAKSMERAQYHRALWAELTAQALELESQAAGGDLAEVARRGAKLIPDRPAAVRALKLRDLRAQSANPLQLTRGKLVLLDQQFRELEANAETGKMVTAWLASERKRLGESDAEGRLRLAGDYIELAGDQRSAAELYIEAERIVPQLDEAVTALGRLGYVKVATTWQLRSEIPAEVLEQQRRARSGAIEVGDSEQDVIQRFRRPDRISRTVSLDRISEQWIYQGPPALYIYLERKAKGGGAVVTGIHAP